MAYLSCFHPSQSCRQISNLLFDPDILLLCLRHQQNTKMRQYDCCVTVGSCTGVLQVHFRGVGLKKEAGIRNQGFRQLEPGNIL
jgi:hypothetical protein